MQSIVRYGILALKGCDTLKFDTRYTFSEEDIQAITLALPLVVRFGADDPIQNFRNDMLCESAGQKLLLHAESFDPNEIRILAAAVEAANLLLAGQISIDVSQEELAELKKHFFTYNKLKAPFDRMIDRLNRQFGTMR